ncbi:hypothetical protein I4U23_011066 [Adineta vaga]|nr:hypothetical protein I4U23_011066 [Adineta vaga]
MHPKTLFYWIYDYVLHYNLFVSEEDELDDNENEPQDQTIIIQHKKYSTWLYILLFIMFFYVFFYIAMAKPQQRTIVISDVTETSITKLNLEYKKTLSCPCSTIYVPPKQFGLNQIKRHPVCTSIFVSQQWIENLYLSNASQYRATDFRTTAHSQFQFLADFCSLVHDIIDQVEIEIENYEFTTVELLSNEQLQSQMDIILESVRNSASTRLMSFINYINTNARSNNFISALNTNTMITWEDWNRLAMMCLPCIS